jgi:DNA-binding NarL/FixJ family response regulator
MGVRILLADDHAIVREGLRAALEREGFEVVGEVANGHDAIQSAEQLRPDIALLDVAMPLLNGIDAARSISKTSGTKCILLTMYSEDHFVLEGIRAGISGYVPKSKPIAELVQAIREVQQGGVYLSGNVSRTIVRAFLEKDELPGEPLSERERQVLQLVAEGKSTKEIATILGISVKTADTHRTNIMRTLNIHDMAGLIRYAVRRGIVTP